MIQIIAYEGLGLGTPTYVKQGLLDRCSELLTHDVVLWRGSFMSKGPTVLPEARGRIVIGHSMGGPSALWYCNQHPSVKFDLELLP